jgi:hypothetical protein
VSGLIQRMHAANDRVAAGDPGYSQAADSRAGRWSSYDRAADRFIAGRSLDCSSSCGMIARMAGTGVNLADPFWTGNIAGRLFNTGLFDTIEVDPGWSLPRLVRELRPGDILTGPGHVVYVRDDRRWWSAESDEHGHASGGAAGDQGDTVGWRRPYLRSAGWATISRPLSVAVLTARALAWLGTSRQATQLHRLTVRSGWAGRRWAAFARRWDAWTAGMDLAYDPADLVVPEAGHAFVVLGSGLTPAGKVSAAFARRLQLAARAAAAHPASLVIVTGGAPRAGVTEAAAGRAWLLDAGVPAGRIVTEDASASTIGNAVGTVPILLSSKITSCTLVSDASHLRRARLLFLACKVALDHLAGERAQLTFRTPLAFNDYGTDTVKTTRPIDARTSQTIRSELLTLLEKVA